MRDKLIELLCNEFTNSDVDWVREKVAKIADHLIANGVIVAPMPMADWLKRELTEYVHKRCMEEL